jgi:hypothetical protein
MRYVPRHLAGVVATLAALVAVGTAGCAGWKGTLPQEEGLHPRLTRFTYLERGKLVAFAVDVQAALQRTDAPVIPLAVGVANRGLEVMTITRESFTLVDPETGRRYAMASVPEARELGSLMSYDLRLSRNMVEVFGGTYESWPRIPATFFPSPAVGRDPAYGRRSLRRDVVELARHSWMADVIYFPRPEGELAGKRLELELKTEEIEDPFLVKFAIKE